MTRHQLLLLAILAGLATVAPARGADEADRLSRSAELDDVERAAALYEARLSQQGASFEARLGAARALVAQMAIRTHGNLPLVDGLQDDEANRSLWSELGSRALEHARAAHDQRPVNILSTGRSLIDPPGLNISALV